MNLTLEKSAARKPWIDLVDSPALPNFPTSSPDSSEPVFKPLASDVPSSSRKATRQGGLGSMSSSVRPFS
eukprot:CAMPEP_0206631556 /NCGR_PEP_ID=MMETSP0325_2-20121206/68298_1 /ASSEMBLY_ACC=CAM_ASM_000347 /TAXON_ID=2866 /ORGANISM="Crypthecodinium cohnii, Strain Seligo" /LENGTH=69 /DNA_ID=CAMNT_0054156747 /DNA_START=44 /DNA_END=250 /DNA_ORIENTATION=+